MVGEASYHNDVYTDAPPLFRLPGGIPEELVFDQDKLLAVSENYGDIIYTYEFKKFKQAMGFEVRSKAPPTERGGSGAAVSLNRMLLILRDHRLLDLII
jgi:transposase